MKFNTFIKINGLALEIEYNNFKPNMTLEEYIEKEYREEISGLSEYKQKQYLEGMKEYKENKFDK